jgi:sugar phosphate isomerase/epimerase
MKSDGRLWRMETFRKMAKEHGSVCGRALRSGRRVVIEDTELDTEFGPFRSAARSAGYRGVVSIRLRPEKDLVGLVATHFVLVHRPTDVQIEAFECCSCLGGRTCVATA